MPNHGGTMHPGVDLAVQSILNRNHLDQNVGCVRNKTK
ncbi:MAG: hypothetical protein OJF50_004687 [Nitrospira sp.]|nr:hypothetical protein [Nitrospira sp.]